MKIPGIRRTNTLYHWFRSRFRIGIITLGYHRISESSVDPFTLSVSPQNFSEQMEILKKHATLVNTERVACLIDKKTIPHRSIAITIDDGYADILYNAKPILDNFNIPATVFIPTGFMGKEFWWDKLHRIFYGPKNLPEILQLSIAGLKVKLTLQDQENQTEYRIKLIKSIYNIIRLLPFVEIEKTLVSLTSQIGNSEQKSCSLCMSDNELKILSESDLIEVGSHGVTHPFLAYMSEEEQKYEVQRSKVDLESIINRPVKSFSYPNGSLTSLTLNLVKEAGYRLAFASIHEMTLSTSHPLRLPRFWIPNWSGDKFYKWLKLWLI